MENIAKICLSLYKWQYLGPLLSYLGSTDRWLSWGDTLLLYYIFTTCFIVVIYQIILCVLFNCCQTLERNVFSVTRQWDPSWSFLLFFGCSLEYYTRYWTKHCEDFYRMSQRYSLTDTNLNVCKYMAAINCDQMLWSILTKLFHTVILAQKLGPNMGEIALTFIKWCHF